MRTLRFLAITTAILALLLPGIAFAASIPRLEGAVTDQADVLGGRSGEVEDALDRLLELGDVQLFVLFVDTTAELTVTEFADETARVNSLGANDALLVVAVDDHTDAIWVSDGLTGVTDAELDQVLADHVEPALRGGDFAAAAIAAAMALADAAGEAPVATAAPAGSPAVTAPPGNGNGGDGSGGAGSIDWGRILGLVLVATGGVMVGVWLISRVSRRRETEERDRQTGNLARAANALLIATDERTRTADEEAGYVEAEFGDAEAKPFHAAIAEARGELRAAFGIRQRLDDSEPEDPPTREAMLKEIVERCQRAGAALDRQGARIAELRQLERDAPTILAALPAQVEAQEQRLPGAEAALAGLQSYAEATWGSVKGNVAEARKGLVGARDAIARGTTAVAATDNRTAARMIGTAQEGIQGATALIDAVEKLAASVQDAAANLADELQAADADLVAARTAASAAHAGSAALGGPSTPGGAAAPQVLAAEASGLARAEEALRAASAAATATPLDPLTAYRLATAARGGAGEVLTAIRRDVEQQAQFAAAVETSLATARSDIDRAADFIATRRAGVGRRARTRLAEAESSLETALSLRETDPRSAMDRARQAERLADEAYSLAVFDFAQWDRGGPSPTGGGADVAGAILGGILGGILSGGGRGGG
ncbi:MAG: TPM domain-containing protein, partial [Chloroflexota bacterium]